MQGGGIRAPFPKPPQLPGSTIEGPEAWSLFAGPFFTPPPPRAASTMLRSTALHDLSKLDETWALLFVTVHLLSVHLMASTGVVAYIFGFAVLLFSFVTFSFFVRRRTPLLDVLRTAISDDSAQLSANVSTALRTSPGLIAVIPSDQRSASDAAALYRRLGDLGAFKHANIFGHGHLSDDVPPLSLPQRSLSLLPRECWAISVPLAVLEAGYSAVWLDPSHNITQGHFWPPSPYELTLSTTDRRTGHRSPTPGPCPEKVTSLRFYTVHPTVNAINALRRADFACQHPDSRQHHKAEAAMASAVHELWVISEHRTMFGCYTPDSPADPGPPKPTPDGLGTSPAPPLPPAAPLAAAIVPVTPDQSNASVNDFHCALQATGALRGVDVLFYDGSGSNASDRVFYRPEAHVVRGCAALAVPLGVLQKGLRVHWIEPTWTVLSDPFYPLSPHDLTVATTWKRHKSRGRRRHHAGLCEHDTLSLRLYSAHPTAHAIDVLSSASAMCAHPKSPQHRRPALALEKALREAPAAARQHFGFFDEAMFGSSTNVEFACQTCPRGTKKVIADPILLAAPAQRPSACQRPTPPQPNPFGRQRIQFALDCLGKSFVHLNRTFLESVTDAEYLIAYERARKLTHYLRGNHIFMFKHGGYGGPWVEEHWMNEAKRIPPLAFKPLIPLFINWQNYMQQHDRSADLWETLELVVDPRFPYVTVNQHDCGNDRLTNTYPNVIVLSSGGYGHVPIPLIRGERPAPRAAPKHVSLPWSSPRGPRSLDVFWKGQVPGFWHRAQALHFLRAHFNVTEGSTGDYEKSLTECAFGFAGRGHGRTSFRLVELLQSHTVPLYVYDDVPWLPYSPTLNWSTFALVYSMKQLPAMGMRLKALQDNPRALGKMQDTLQRYRDSHFTYKGLMRHMRLLLTEPPRSDLVCSRLPAYSGADLWPPKCLGVRNWRWEEWRTPEHIDRW